MKRDSCHFPQNDVWCAVVGKKKNHFKFTNSYLSIDKNNFERF